MYGIEQSSIAEQAAQIVSDNHYQDRVTIVRGKVEEVQLPVEKVSIALQHLRSVSPARYSGCIQPVKRPLTVTDL